MPWATLSRWSHPQAVSWLPQTTGWWLLGIGCWRWHCAMAGAGCATGTATATGAKPWRGCSKYPRQGRPGPARRSQQAVEAHRHGSLFPGARRQLVRGRVGGFLNRQCAQPPFTPEQSQCLAHGAYRPLVLTTANRDALLAASLAWVQQHRGTTMFELAHPWALLLLPCPC